MPFTWDRAPGYDDTWHLEIGLYHVGARAYDPHTARWLQRDPIDAASGDPNLYRYCGNDPVNEVDSCGLDWLTDLANFFAGWGDTLSGGLTNWIREQIGVNEVVDPCSEAYRWGSGVGEVHDLAMGGRGKAARQALKEGRKKASTQAGREVKKQVAKQGGHRHSEVKKSGPPPRKPTGYTPHARDRMRQRGISEQQVEDIMRQDKSPRKQENGRYRYQRGGVVVIVDPDGTVVTVIVKK
jgi:RHS repeat-associated protein